MELLKELYVYIFTLADDLASTQALRAVSRTAYSASYVYFKTLLKEPIIISYNHNYRWEIFNKDTNMKDIIDRRKHYHMRPAHSHGSMSDSPGKAMISKTTIKNLYNTFSNYKVF